MNKDDEKVIREIKNDSVPVSDSQVGNIDIVSFKDFVIAKKEELKEIVKKCDRPPFLAVIQIGDNPASNSYIKGKKKDAEECGLDFELFKLDEDKCDQEELEAIISVLNDSPLVDGIILQLPVKDSINVQRIQELIDPTKDVDGFNKTSMFEPCTPAGIMSWFEYNNIDLTGKAVCIINRSNLVGRPLAKMMLDKDATVTVCHSKTKDLKFHTKTADILVVAVGKAKFINSTYLGFGTKIVIDVGINRDSNGKLCGDVWREQIESARPDVFVSRVPLGVGLSTRAMLVENTVKAYEMQNKGE